MVTLPVTLLKVPADAPFTVVLLPVTVRLVPTCVMVMSLFSESPVNVRMPENRKPATLPAGTQRDSSISSSGRKRFAWFFFLYVEIRLGNFLSQVKNDNEGPPSLA